MNCAVSGERGRGALWMCSRRIPVLVYTGEEEERPVWETESQRQAPVWKVEAYRESAYDD